MLVYMREEWKQLVIDGVCLKYTISNMGRILSHKTNKLMKFEDDRGWKRVRVKLPSGNMLHTGVHRLVGLMFVDGYKEGLVINHKDGDKSNNWFWNLEWVTQAENEEHARVNGLKASGERHYGNIYSEESIRAVCKMLENKSPYGEIVKKTGVDLNVVYDVKNKKSWVNISDQYNIPTNKNTKYSRYYQHIYSLFEQGYKTKKIMNILGIPTTDSKFKSLMNRLREKYNKGLFVVQRLSPRGT